LQAAQREFAEEVGQQAPSGALIELGSFKRGAKEIFAWAVEGTLDASQIRSNVISIEWPPKSGKTIEIPEVDRAEWVSLDKASVKLHTGQDILIQRLAEKLRVELSELPQQQSLL
jgi:predicted NUDIX family NTP pyrophosphohydrolase